MTLPAISRSSPSLGAASMSRAGPPFQKLRPSDHFVRAVLAAARSEFARTIDPTHPYDPVRVARKTWSGDDVTPTILARTDQALMETRSAISPADTTTSGWAADLVTFAWPDFLTSLAPTTAAGGLFSRVHMINFNDNGVVVIPGMLA